MELLTYSPHIIDIFEFCALTVTTEFAGGLHVGTLADESKRTSLSRFKIARDARRLVGIHEIDGDAHATLVHRDVNLEILLASRALLS